MKENTIAGIFIIGLVLGGLLLLTRKPAGAGERVALNRRVSSEANYLPLVEDRPSNKPAKHYQNLEQWHVKWSPDGDECFVDIKRNATQS